MVAHMYSVLGARLTCTATARAVSCTRRRHNTPSSLHRAISARAPTCAAFLRRIASWLSMVAHDQRSCRDPWARIADECWAECDPFSSPTCRRRRLCATLDIVARTCVSQPIAKLLHALLHTYIGVGCADLSGRCLFGVVRIHTGDRVNTNGGRAVRQNSGLGSQGGSA